MSDRDRLDAMEATTGIISYGGGVQSTAMLVLWINEGLDAEAAVHANVGDNAEHPDTIRYIHEVAIPRLKAAGKTLHIVQSHRGDLHDLLMDDPKFQGIPIRMSQSGAPGYRTCTSDWKRDPLRKWKKDNGYGHLPNLLGISTDEMRRARIDPDVRYPLIEMDISRALCETIIRAAGWPVPPKSACWFCPYHSIQNWSELRRDRPDLFDRAIQLEERINEKRPDDDPAWLSSRGRPLGDAIYSAQPELWDACDEGYCFV